LIDRIQHNARIVGEAFETNHHMVRENHAIFESLGAMVPFEFAGQ
jgi:hypothetical protein